MESQNLVAAGQTSDTSYPITDGAKVVEGPVGVVAAGDGGVMVELCGGRGGRRGEVAMRKQGRPPKVQAKVPPAKKSNEEEEEEDVCFLCFDGGSLVLCDRRGCPKAYHPACVKRDEAFFESTAKWNCGWHICSICQKSAHHMCYTCTYSLCRACIKKADYVRVRGDKGFCSLCMKTIMLIENNGQGEDGKVQADFDDKLSWEYLFKVYWVYLKGKLSLTLDELTIAKNSWKEARTVCSPVVVHNIAKDLRNITSATSLGNPESNESKRRKIDDDEIKILPTETVNIEKPENEETVECNNKWATKELLDFVSHMKDGNTSALSRFDVLALVTEYINRNNLSDPRQKNQIVCDSRLKNLFGKSSVGRIQMLKLLESHFYVSKNLRKRKVKSTEELDDADWNPNNRPAVGKIRKPRNHSRGEECTQQNCLDEFAAVDVHNMNIIYLRRDLMAILLEDAESFHSKVVGSIVRVRISGNDQEHDMYRLVQVVGTGKADKPYKIDSKLTEVMLEVLNIDKKETILIDAISDQEFSEEECIRLQQSIKCGLVKHFTVGEIQEKAMVLKSVKLNDWIEKGILRLSHLHDSKLQDIMEVHSDPKMNPGYQSDDSKEYISKEHGNHSESKYSGASIKNPHSLTKRAGSTRSRKNAPLNNGSCFDFKKDAPTLTSGKSQNEVDGNASTITKLDHQPTLSSSITNSAPKTIASSLPSNPDEMAWHYRDPSGKVQGPFSLTILQRWSAAGYFPADMKIWEKQEENSLLLNDILKEHFGKHDVCQSEIITADNKAGNQTEGHIVCTATPSSPNSTIHKNSSNGRDSSGQSSGQNWSANNNLKPTSTSGTMSTESPGKLKTSNMPREMERNEVDITPLPTASKDANAARFDLPTWHEMGETIELSTLAEESVSDLLAEYDAMESQYGMPSPTSRRNSFVDDLFNDEFSPAADQGTGSEGFSSSGDIHMTPNGLQHHSQRENSGFGRPDMEKGMIDINRSARAEGDDGEMETKTRKQTTGVVSPLQTLKSACAKLVTKVAKGTGLGGTSNHRKAGAVVSPPLTLGFDPFEPDEL